MSWKSRWSEEHPDAEALKQQLTSEGFDAYQWTGRPGGAYLDYITRKMKSSVCCPARLM